MRRVESFSPSDRDEHSESISSMKMMALPASRAISNRLRTKLRAADTQGESCSASESQWKPTRVLEVCECECECERMRACVRHAVCCTHRSLSPCHFDTRSDEDTEKNVESASVATAFARYDFPVPGGCVHHTMVSTDHNEEA